MKKMMNMILAIQPRWFALALLLDVSAAVAVAALPGSPFRATLAAPAGSTNLGAYTLLNGSAAQGNALTLLYGNSVEGGGLTTYWQNGQVQISVLSVGNSQYELVESLGSRCMTVTGSTVTVATCTGSAAQLLTLTAQSGGTYAIAAAGECVEAPGSFSTVAAQACNGSAGQSWTLTGKTPLVLAPAPAPVAPVTPTPAPPTPAPAPVTPVQTAGTTLGSWSLLNEGASQGNSLTLSYGSSSEGNSLTTYWAGNKPGFNVVAMANSQYELVENTGSRCMTVTPAAVSVTTCSGTPSQLLTLTAQPDGSYLLGGPSGLCVQAPASFSSVAPAACGTSATQHWNFSGATPLVLPTKSVPVVSNPPSPTVPANYHLTFDDEFSSLSLSDQNGAGTKWYTHTVQCCLYDTSAPSTPTVMAGITAPAGQDPYSLVPGGLDIRLEKTNGTWYSGVMATVDQTGKGFAQQYGYFEMKAMFPSGLGTWPAFWLLNQAALTNGAPAGEIDIVESYMQFPTYINTTLHNWTPPATTPGYQQASVANLSAGFHTFGMLWTASTITIYCDGATLYSFPTPSIMNQPYYPIIDLGLGGGWPTAQTPQQSDLIVQYMRVYAAN